MGAWKKINDETKLLQKFGHSYEKDIKETDFYNKYFINVTDTVEYNPCLRLIKSGKKNERFIVNSDCDFEKDFWKLEYLSNENCNRLKTDDIKDDIKTRSIVWNNIEKYLSEARPYQNVTLLSCRREFTQNLNTLFYTGTVQIENKVKYNFRISSLLSPVY